MARQRDGHPESRLAFQTWFKLGIGHQFQGSEPSEDATIRIGFDAQTLMVLRWARYAEYSRPACRT